MVLNGPLDISEKNWQSQVLTIAKQLGWKGAYHTFDSRRSSSGFPDLVLVRDRVVFVELKSETGTLSPAQRQWLQWLLHAGAEVYIARPRDLEAVGNVLGPAGLKSSQAAGLAETTRAEIS